MVINPNDYTQCMHTEHVISETDVQNRLSHLCNKHGDVSPVWIGTWKLQTSGDKNWNSNVV